MRGGSGVSTPTHQMSQSSFEAPRPATIDTPPPPSHAPADPADDDNGENEDREGAEDEDKDEDADADAEATGLDSGCAVMPWRRARGSSSHTASASEWRTP